MTTATLLFNSDGLVENLVHTREKTTNGATARSSHDRTFETADFSFTLLLSLFYVAPPLLYQLKIVFYRLH
jgi:hypothetical protein